jgi:tetratricopeptide (TPR) repeat protein
MDTRQVVARFEAERQALALMDHPNIAKVLDGGQTTSGRPYFVMDLVKGVPITKYCDENHLTPRQRLELFVPICHAIQHAHQKGVIHRDLKPSNVLVALYDDKPVPKVIDFGVAKATGTPLTEETLHTGFGAVVGTLEYMSPEQAELNNQDIDTRSDVYSLGVLLYELLTGTTPLDRKRLKDAPLLELLRVIREQDAPTLSNRLSTTEELPAIAANRGLEPAKLTRLLRGELNWIAMKALEKDRNRRYETANGFAMDVQRYLADEPVLACPPSAWYRFAKFARRNKGGLAVAALVLFYLVLLGGSAGWTVRDRAARHARVAGQVEMILSEVDRLEREQNWPEALAAARRAEAAATGGEADAATAHRVRALLKDLEFIDRLEQIRMQRATQVAGTYDFVGADREYARAFRAYGVDVELLSVETSIDRLKALTALAIPLAAAALDDWVYTRGVTTKADVASRKRLVAIARGIDPNPLRDRIRATWGQPNSEAQDELSRLADSIDVRAQHPATLIILSLRQVKRSESVLRLLRDAQYVYPGDFWLNLELGHAMYEVEDHHAAIRYLSAAVSIRPNSANAHLSLGAVLCDGKRDYEGAATCFRRATELDPKYALAHYNLGNALFRQKKLDEAIAAYRWAAALDPNLFEIQLSLGAVLCDGKHDYEGAAACFHRAIEIDSHRAGAHYNLGIALKRQGKLDEAITAFREAIRLDSKHLGAHLALGAVLCDGKHDYEGAATCFHSAIKIDPDRAGTHYNLGIALKRQGKLDEAIGAFREAIRLDPGLASAHRNLGEVLWRKGVFADAIASFKTAVRLAPTDANGINDLAELLATCPDPKYRDGRRAVELAMKAVELDKSDGVYRRTLAWAQYRAGDWKAAIAAMEKVKELGSAGDSFEWFLLAMAHWRLENKDEARRWFDQAVAWMDRNDPRNEELLRFRAEAAKLLGVEKKKD